MEAMLDRPKMETKASRAAAYYEPELDVLRFCAFLAVFGFHALPADYSDLVPRLGHAIPMLLRATREAMSFGVCLFFLLSSYLITKLLTMERTITGAISLRKFYVRRILRIWPLYVGFLLLMWAIGGPRLNHFAPIAPGRLLAFLLFSGNIYVGLFGFSGSGILPLWTISIEEQFYIVWPAIARRGSAFVERAAWGVIAISAAAVVLLARYSSNATHVLWTSSLVQFQFFAFGALVALRYIERSPAFGGWQRTGMFGSGIALLVLATGRFDIKVVERVPAHLLIVGYEVMAVGVVLIFLAFLGAGRGWQIPKSLTYLGKISYGLYVFHDISLVVCRSIAERYGLNYAVRTASAAAMTLGLAMISYRYVEKPFLRAKDRFAVVHTRSG
jgi:peptidoglycan/LPS O-acetylase OafA/YrhL